MANSVRYAQKVGRDDHRKGTKNLCRHALSTLVLWTLASDHDDAAPLPHLWTRVPGRVAGASASEREHLMAKLGQWQRQMLTLLETHGPLDGEALTLLVNGQADKRTRYLCARALRQLGKRGLIAHGESRAHEVYALTSAGVQRLEEDPWFARKEFQP
jgi:hypothetical protein